MAAYWYVEDKQQLLNLVAKKMLAEVPLPDPESGTWDERLRKVVASIDAKLREHPGIAEILLQRMLSTDRRLMNGVFEILISAGFEGPETFLTYAMIHTYLFGRYQVVLHADELPDEEQVDNLEDLVDAKGLDAAQLEKTALLGHKVSLIGKLAQGHPPEAEQGKKTRKSWNELATEMQTTANELAAAAHAKKDADIGKIANKLTGTCTKCHDIFR